MKTILLMRHAKSTWKDHQLPDVERPLNAQGFATARLVGTSIWERELVPQLILSSSATRACQTAELVAEAAGHTASIQILSSFYLAEAPIYLGALSVLSDEIERVMLIGHNPGLESLLQMLTHRIESLSTGAVAYISLPLQNWHELNTEVEGELIELIIPENKKDKKEEKEKDKKEEKKAGKKKEKKEEREKKKGK